MAEMRGTPRASEVIREYFARRAETSSRRRADRLARAEADLHGCLDDLAPFLLNGQERALLALEQQFEAAHATARVVDAGTVLLVLPVYLDAPRWHGHDLEDRRLRIRLAEDLAAELVRIPALRAADLGKAAQIVDAAVQHETWMLRQELEAARRR